MKSRLITNDRASVNRHSDIRQAEFDRDLLARRKFPGHNRTQSSLADIGAAAGQILGNSELQHGQVNRNVNGLSGEKPPQRLIKCRRWKRAH
jgi:hypothetical protein